MGDNSAIPYEVLRAGDLGEIQKLVELGADIYGEFNGQSYMFYVARHGHLPVMRYLTGLGLRPGRDYNAQKCANYVISGGGGGPVLQYLIEQGADVAACAIHASLRGKLSMVPHLLSLGNDICINECLKMSYYGGHLSMAKFLVANGADIRSYDNICARCASSNGSTALVEYSVSIGADICASSNRCARLAASFGRVDTVHYLASIGACPPYAILANELAGGQISEYAYLLLSQSRAAEDARRNAARQLYFWWVPRCFDLARRGGRRTRARNFAAYARMRHTC